MKKTAEEKDGLRAFAQRVEKQVLAAKKEGMENMERLVCRLLSDGKNPKIQAVMAAKWVEWRYGKPTQEITHSGGPEWGIGITPAEAIGKNGDGEWRN